MINTKIELSYLRKYRTYRSWNSIWREAKAKTFMLLQFIVSNIISFKDRKSSIRILTTRMA